MGNNFRFLTKNEIQTTSVINVDCSTTQVINLFDRNTATVWQSNGYSGSTVTTIVWTPTSPTAISRIYLQNCNFGQFQIFYNGTTTNQFTPAIAANSATAKDMYFEFSTITVSSVYVQATTTYTIGQEKKVGELYIGDQLMEFPHNPGSGNYEPVWYRKGDDIEMSDGGMISIYMAHKFRASMEISFVSSSDIASFRSAWNRHNVLHFIPYPLANGYFDNTSTTWDGMAYECNWLGDFDALKVSDNVLGNGYNVAIELGETPL